LGKFVRNAYLEELSMWTRLRVDYVNSKIISYSRGGWGHFLINYFIYQNGMYKLVGSREAEVHMLRDLLNNNEERNHIWQITTKRLINDEMVITDVSLFSEFDWMYFYFGNINQ